jgi:hypothetical protein
MTRRAVAENSLYDNRVFAHHINVLRSHIFAVARHAVPLPGDPVSPNFKNRKLRFMNIKLDELVKSTFSPPLAGWS